MIRAVVCCATTPRYQRGMARLAAATQHMGPVDLRMYDQEPKGSPLHKDVPYGFKAVCLKDAADRGADLLLWADSCMLPIKSMEPLWERIERDGYWMSRNGYTNYEWTADSAYPELFPEEVNGAPGSCIPDMQYMRLVNKKIEHVVATCFGINVRHPKGKAFLDEYYRLASQTKAFCGQWTNTPETPCGPADVRGHRHDQTAASVIAWRLGMELTSPPEIFAYGRADEQHDERTILLASGEYE